MHLHILFITIFMLTSVSAIDATTDDEIIDYLSDLPNQEYFDGDWDIASEEGTPVIIWKDNCYGADECVITISAWIDIIGFRNESIINGTRYINGSGKDFVIIRRGAEHHTPGGCVFVSFKSELFIYDVQWIDGTWSTEAAQVSTFVYKEWICYDIPGFGAFCYWQHYTDMFRVSYRTDAPYPYTIKIQDIPIRVVVCNQSFRPVTHIIIPDTLSSTMEGVMDIQVVYNGSNTSRYDKMGFVMDNNRGTEHVEFVPFDDPTWTDDDNQTNISHFLNAVTVSDPNFNMSNLCIQMRGPYETRNATNYTIVEMDNPPISPNVPLLKVFALYCGAVVMVLTLAGVVTRAIF